MVLRRLSPLLALVPLLTAAPHHATGMAPEEALRTLREGNKRYVAARPRRPHQASSRRVSLTRGQQPFAVVLGCANSRVPPEIIFDQGLGDLFVIRVAGNIADDAALASIEYAVQYLGTRLIVVLGHDRCGAVDAALQGGEAPGHLGSLVSAIAPAVESTRGKPGDRMANAIRANVARVVEQLKSSQPILADRVSAGKVKVIGACYALKSGAVEMVR